MASKAPEFQRTTETGEDAHPPAYFVPTQAGVRKAEALQNPRIWGKTSKIILFIGVGIMAWIYSLDGVTTYLYTQYATSSFGQHSLLGAVGTVAAIVLAVGKPVSAKVADVLGRAEAWALAVLLYTVGYIVLASCTSVGSYAGGWIIRTAGYAAVQILMQIVIGDVTSLRYRTLMSSLVSAPYLVNGFVGARIAASVYTESGWRWGYGMFAILIPGSAVIIIGILAWSQIKAYRLGVVHTANPYVETQLREKKEELGPDANKLKLAGRAFLLGCQEVDLVGLLLFSAGWTCLLLPLTIVNGGKLTWGNYKIITMLTLGPIILIGMAIYEARFAKFPFIPSRFLKNRTVLAAALIGFFDFISFYLQFTYQYSFIAIAKDWSVVDQTYFSQTQTISLTLFAILAGLFIVYFRRYKWLLMGGLLLRLFAVGLMIHSKGARGSTVELVLCQLLQGAGGGIAAVVAQTAAQASVPHQDLASVTAVILLFAEIGGAIGTAIVSAIWRNVMPGQLQLHLAGLTDQEGIDAIYASVVTAATYPYGSPIRVATIEAYDYTMKIILIAATIFAVVPPLLVLMMREMKFGDQQNDVERRATDGESIDDLDMDKKTVH